MTIDPASGPWHVDKRIPVMQILAIWGALTVQASGAFWWASSITERVGNLETFKNETKNIASDIAVIKSQLADIKDSQKRLIDRLDNGKLDFHQRGGAYQARPAERQE